MEPQSITLEVVTPERQVVSETVSSVQVPARAGYLGILPGHAPLLTEMGTGELSYLKDGEKYFAVVCGGFAEVLPARVTVLADSAERCEEIDVERARAARDRAQKRLSGHDPETDWNRAAAALERALVRLQVATKGGGVAAAANGRTGSR
jgi:F-type H+-transporting ATPase subunit epsilon